MTTTRPSLDHWVELLELVLPEDENGVLVRLADLGDTAEIGLLPLHGVHPLELLDGFEAPAEWFAFGLIARGWASPMDDEQPSRHPARRRVTSTVLLDRDGHVAGRTIDEAGEVVIDGPPTEGAVLDALKAALSPGRGSDLGPAPR